MKNISTLYQATNNLIAVNINVKLREAVKI